MSGTARRTVGAAQLGFGAVTLIRPHATVRALTSARTAMPPPLLVRVLGARQVTQGVVSLAAPTTQVLNGGAVIDLLHALSLVPVVSGSQRYRRAASVSAGLAVAAAVAGALAARR